MLPFWVFGAVSAVAVVRRAGEVEAAFKELVTVDRDYNNGVCGDRETLTIPIRSDDGVETLHVPGVSSLDRFEGQADAHGKIVAMDPPRESGARLEVLLKRYQRKVDKLVSAIEHVAEKTAKKGEGNRFQRPWSVGSHLESTGVQETVERMRGFEKCRGFLRDIEDDHVEDSDAARAIAAELRALLTEGDDCCDESCDITKVTATMVKGVWTQTPCVPCRPGCAKNEAGEPELAYTATDYKADGSLDNIFKGLPKQCKTISDGAHEADPALLAKGAHKFCYQQCKCPKGHAHAGQPVCQCRGLKSLARRAARELEITLSYDVCPASTDMKRDGSARICGPFAPRAGNCQIKMEHVLVRGNAREAWEGEYAQAMAFGKMCASKGSLYERWSDTLEQGGSSDEAKRTKALMAWASWRMASSNSNGDEEDE